MSDTTNIASAVENTSSLNRSEYYWYSKDMAIFRRYKEDGIKHFSSKRLPVELLTKLIELLGQKRFAQAHLSNNILPDGLPIGFDYLVFESALSLDEQGFKDYLIENHNELSRTISFLVLQLGDDNAYDHIIETISVLFNDDEPQPTPADIRTVMKGHHTAHYKKLIESLARLHYLVRTIGEIEFVRNCEAIKEGNYQPLGVWCNKHHALCFFFNRNRTLIVDWIKAMMQHSGTDDMGLYALLHMGLSDKGLDVIGEVKINQILNGGGVADDDSERVAVAIMQYTAYVASLGYRSYTKDNIPF